MKRGVTIYNKESISVHVLGSGTCTPYARRSSPALALQIGGRFFLVDCGSGTLKRIADAELQLSSIRTIFITHLHLDHTGDLPSLLFSLRNCNDLPDEYELMVYGPTGVRSYVNALISAHQPWLSALPFPLRVEELKKESKSLIDWKFFTYLMHHSDVALGYRFETASRSLAISGDTDYCQSAVELCRSAQLAILECSTPDNQKIAGHLTPRLAARIAEEAQCERLILTHLYPQTDEIDLLPLCKELYSGEVIVAEDLMTFTV